MPSATSISVIIPTLNEAVRLPATLAAVQAQAGPLETVVADGGSDDATVDVASGRARVVQSPPGRGRQMNAGAAAARGDVLLFLHADTLLPPGALAAVRAVLADPAAEAGTFRLRFDRRSPLLRCYGACTWLPLPHLCFGDRGLFVRRTVFDAVGGYPEWPMFEDLELAARLHRRGGFHFLRSAVTTAARRFEAQGLVRQQLRNAYLWTHYQFGTDPRRLAHLYAYTDATRGDAR